MLLPAALTGALSNVQKSLHTSAAALETHYAHTHPRSSANPSVLAARLSELADAAGSLGARVEDVARKEVIAAREASVDAMGLLGALREVGACVDDEEIEAWIGRVEDGVEKGVEARMGGGLEEEVQRTLEDVSLLEENEAEDSEENEAGTEVVVKKRSGTLREGTRNQKVVQPPPGKRTGALVRKTSSRDKENQNRVPSKPSSKPPAKPSSKPHQGRSASSGQPALSNAGSAEFTAIKKPDYQRLPRNLKKQATLAELNDVHAKVFKILSARGAPVGERELLEVIGEDSDKRIEVLRMGFSLLKRVKDGWELGKGPGRTVG